MMDRPWGVFLRVMTNRVFFLPINFFEVF